MTITAVEPLSTLLRDGSRAEHTAAEGSRFMRVVLDGQISREAYGDYLLRLHGVYSALERVGRELAADAMASAVVDPALARVPALESDLDFWVGAQWRDRRLDSAATAAYVRRVEQAGEWGGLFVAHHYTRYLGDLSGGQAIGRILGRAYDLTDGLGLAFYDFAQIPKPKPYKDAYRARLDALELSGVERERILDEVKVVFGLNGALFDELSAGLPGH